METREWKKSCTVTCDVRTFDGIAHLVEFKYDERFAPWFAAIQLADHNAMSVPSEIEMAFDGGGKAFCRVISRHNDGIESYFEGEMETPTVQLYVVGISKLSRLSITTGEERHLFE